MAKRKYYFYTSRFLKKDRKSKEDTIRQRFKRDAKPDDIILVATQVIEVGLDISCENPAHTVSSCQRNFTACGKVRAV